MKYLYMAGASDFIDHECTFSLLRLNTKFNFTIPELIINGHEDLSGRIFKLAPYWGYGLFHLNITGGLFFVSPEKFNQKHFFQIFNSGVK